MWKSKKFIMILTLAIVALIGGTTGAVLAAAGDETGNVATTEAETQRAALLDRICEIYEENYRVAIDPDQLQAAFQQAEDELREQALTQRLQAMVDNGAITQEDADLLMEWWQARPDVEGFMEGPMVRPHRGGTLLGCDRLCDGAPYCGDGSCDTTACN